MTQDTFLNRTTSFLWIFPAKTSACVQPKTQSVTPASTSSWKGSRREVRGRSGRRARAEDGQVPHLRGDRARRAVAGVQGQGEEERGVRGHQESGQGQD